MHFNLCHVQYPLMLSFEHYFAPSDSALGLVLQLRLKLFVPCTRQAAVQCRASPKDWFDISKQIVKQTVILGACTQERGHPSALWTFLLHLVLQNKGYVLQENEELRSSPT